MRLLADEALAPLLKSLGPALSPLPSVKFDSGTGERALKAHYGVARSTASAPSAAPNCRPPAR